MAFSDILKIVKFSDVPDGTVFYEGIAFDENTRADFTMLKKLGNTGLEPDTGDLFDYEDDAFVFVIAEQITTELKFTLTVKITNAHQPIIDRIESLLLDGTSIDSAESVLEDYIVQQDDVDNFPIGWDDYGWNVFFDISPYPAEGVTPENSVPRARTHVHGTKQE